MAKRFLSVLSAAGLVALLAPIAVSTGAAEVTCRIPFEFSVHGKALSAGHYHLSTQGTALLIRGAADGAVVLGTPTSSGPDTASKLVFEKFDNAYTLREVWMGGKTGRELPLSRTDRERRKDARHGQVERIVIAGM